MTYILQKAVKKVREDGILSTIQVGLDMLWAKIEEPLMFKLYTYGIVEVDHLYAKDYYENMSRREALHDASVFAELVIERYNPGYVVDLGCGTGRFLKPFHDAGVKVYGVDGSHFAVSNPIDDSLTVEQYDLTNKLRLEEEADVVICLEVLEHLPEGSAIIAAGSIQEAAPVAIVTMAKPGQGGTYHVNEQPLEYWIEIFNDVGMEHHEEDTEFLKKNMEPKELYWLRNNIAVFHRKG